MESFGAQLKQERERKGVTLEDISLTTKIGTRMLRACTRRKDTSISFPAAFSTRVSSAPMRAVWVWIEELPSYRRLSNRDWSHPVRPRNPRTTRPRSSSPHRENSQNPATAGLPWGTFAVVLLIVALGFAGWGFYSPRIRKRGQRFSRARAERHRRQPSQHCAGRDRQNNHSPSRSPLSPEDSTARHFETDRTTSCHRHAEPADCIPGRQPSTTNFGRKPAAAGCAVKRTVTAGNQGARGLLALHLGRWRNNLTRTL